MSMDDIIRGLEAQAKFRSMMSQYEVVELRGQKFYKTEGWYVPTMAGYKCQPSECNNCGTQLCIGYIKVEDSN